MISDEDLMLLSAYMDGELDATRMNELRERLREEPELRRELEEMQTTDELVKSYSSRIDTRAVPGSVTSLLQNRQDISRFRPYALAASILLLAGGLIAAFVNRPEPALIVLDRIESGQRVETNEGNLEVIATFRHHNGSVCREYQMNGERSIACHAGEGWEIVLSVPSMDTPQEIYQPAGSGDLSAIDDYISRNKQGDVLTLSEEKALIRNGWR